ncbi:MAG: [FeFe] hydrogenase H-cluster maturation GTPase HydF [Lachnospiraceae bacterium]|nr:[FeFe] hydrogenase H-cluster maturation GTPase HydF [Lachnospiraceae bacterium]
MSLNNTPAANRIHIGIFGRRNAGKSSVINAITGQSLAIVSDIKGTTTDPVSKAMELLPLGPVVIIDTPGLDDIGELGAQRIQKAYQVLNKTDIAILVVDASVGFTREDEEILKRIYDKKIPYVTVLNKIDRCEILPEIQDVSNTICVSAITGYHIQELKEMIAAQTPDNVSDSCLVRDLIAPSDFVILVVPIDKAAPKGRLILPQQQTIRDILDGHGVSIVVSPQELPSTIASLGKKPALVITDSQVFEEVAQLTPKELPLTSFSILFARYKGSLSLLSEGALTIDQLKDGDTILISEGCTHHRQCGDIGTEKLPAWLQKHTGKQLQFEFTSGTEFPEELQKYRLIIHCGGCMLNEREMKYRLLCAKDQNIPVTNYGMAIAHMKGILKRSMEIFS